MSNTDDQYKEYKDAADAAKAKHAATCPACGYCPHCGRSNAHPWHPAPACPPPVPFWQTWPWYGNGTASITTTDGQSYDITASAGPPTEPIRIPTVWRID